MIVVPPGSIARADRFDNVTIRPEEVLGMTHAPTERKLDPITFEVLRRAFEYASERMSQVLQKASFSPIIYDMVDYSNAIFDPNVELIGQTANCPVHIAAMHFSARASLKRYPLETLGPDDVIVLNDPYQGGTHTPDVTMTLPIFHDGELLAIAVSRAHWTDIGGNLDTHIAGEGLRLPPLMLYKDGQLNTDLVEIIKNSTRTPQYVEGDIQAQLGALRAGRDEMQRIAAKYGAEVVKQGMTEVLDYTQRMTAAAIARIPDGVYEAEDYVDSDGFSDDPVYVRVKLTVDGDRIEVDMTGSDPATVGPINSPYANTASAIYYSLKFFLNPDAPPNAGLYRQIDLTIPEGTWLNPKWPSPTFGCTTAASSKITGAIWLALAKAIPDQVIAPGCSECNWFVATRHRPGDGRDRRRLRPARRRLGRDAVQRRHARHDGPARQLPEPAGRDRRAAVPGPLQQLRDDHRLARPGPPPRRLRRAARGRVPRAAGRS